MRPQGIDIPGRIHQCGADRLHLLGGKRQHLRGALDLGPLRLEAPEELSELAKGAQRAPAAPRTGGGSWRRGFRDASPPDSPPGAARDERRGSSNRSPRSRASRHRNVASYCAHCSRQSSQSAALEIALQVMSRPSALGGIRGQLSPLHGPLMARRQGGKFLRPPSAPGRWLANNRRSGGPWGRHRPTGVFVGRVFVDQASEIHHRASSALASGVEYDDRFLYSLKVSTSESDEGKEILPASAETLAKASSESREGLQVKVGEERLQTKAAKGLQVEVEEEKGCK